MLKPRKRISKREIKEDPLVTYYVRIQKLIQRYSRQIQIGLAVVLGIVVIAIFTIRSQQQAENSAENEMAMAESLYYNQMYDEAADALSRVMENFEGTDAAGRAAYLMGNISYQNGEYADAEAYYREYLKSNANDHWFSVPAMAGIAACKESMNSPQEAAEWYERAARKYPDNFEAPFQLKNAARCYLAAADTVRAKKLYHAILDRYPDSGLTGEIEFIIAAL